MSILNTLVVACSHENFEQIFIGENSWYPISIDKNKISQIKFVVAYRKMPVAAITHLAEIEMIIPYENTKKYKVIFKEKPKEIMHIPMGQDQRNVPQNPRYTTLDNIKNSKNMDSLYILNKKA